MQDASSSSPRPTTELATRPRTTPPLEHGPTRYFYRYGLDRFRASADVQHTLGRPSLRLLIGAGAASDEGRSHALRQRLDAHRARHERPPTRRNPHTNYVRAGLTWDTRDREIGTTSGTWADVLVQRVDSKLGASCELHAMDRHRAPLSTDRRTRHAGQSAACCRTRSATRRSMSLGELPDDAEVAGRARGLEQRARNSQRPVRRKGNRSSRTTSCDGEPRTSG